MSKHPPQAGAELPTPGPAKKLTILDLQRKKEGGEPISVVTAYDLSSARLAEAAGIDALLVGDSLGMVMLGYETTLPVTMDEMVHHCRAVARGAKRALLIGDLPFLSYQADAAEALRNAGRLMKQGGMDAVKLEGAGDLETVARMVRSGIPVMGHLGLTPQSVFQLGGYRVQGRTAESARRLLGDALALEAAGCFSIVLEMVPAEVAELVSRSLSIPTIGIGAGAACDGQVLVYHDLLGLYDDFQPRFVKRYAELGPRIRQALSDYHQDVKERRFPAGEHAFEMPPEELRALRDGLEE